MLFTESNLTTNGLHILNEGISITEQESFLHPSTIPISEVSRLNTVQIPYNTLLTFAEENGYSFQESLSMIAEAHDLNIENLSVCIQEEDIILDPDLINEFSNIIISPISSNDEIYQLCEETINAYVESEDEKYLLSLLEEPNWGEGPLQNPIAGAKDKFWGIKHHMTTKNPIGRIKNVIKRNPYKAGTAIAMAAGPIGTIPASALQLYGGAKSIQRIYKKFKNRPRSVIAKKIASLRKLYETWLHRAKIEKDDKTAGVLKTIATNIMLLIDKLLELLQKGADKLSGH